MTFFNIVFDLSRGGYTTSVGSDRCSTDTTKEFDMSGTTDKISGRVKQAAGDLTDDQELKNDGETDEAAGKVKDGIDDAKDKLNSAVDKVKDSVS